MHEETVGQRGTTLVRRRRLEPGEATAWHVDPFHRLTVVVRGTALALEFRDGAGPTRVALAPGQVDWDAPTDRVHRAVNVGPDTYEEVIVWFLDHPGATPQPTAE